MQDRSEEDDGLQSDFSCEEDGNAGQEEYEGDKEKGFNQEEQLENAENQKISFEKMSSSLHRLHVEFDDLSVVDEEEELKKDKERKEATPSLEEQRSDGARHLPPPFLGPRQLHDNIPFYPATYEPTGAFSGTSYYTECPFEFPNTVDLMLPTDALLASPCSGLQNDPLIPLARLDSRSLDQATESMLPRIHVPPVGWQNDVVPPKHPPAYSGTSVVPGSSDMQAGTPDSRMSPSDVYGFLRRKNAKQSMRIQDALTQGDSRTRLSSPEEATGRNAWDFGVDSTDGRGAMIHAGRVTPADNRVVDEATAMSTVPERPKHFFAPLPSKLKKQEEESPTASTSHFGTGTSSSSGKTASTVISRTNPFVGQKGSADIYVNGMVPYDGEDVPRDRDESKTFLSTDNLLLAEHNRVAPSSGQLTKSISCQDLSSEGQSATQQSRLSHADGKTQMLTKSDNTLDNITNGSCQRPYKSHLNVTLKIPRLEEAPSPETPEIPNLPSIDYRLFRNPFLRNFDKLCPNYRVEPSPPATKPLSVQVNDDSTAYQYNMPAYGRAVHLDERFRVAHLSDKNRLLIPSDQLMSGKQDIQVTSFERPSPCNLIPSATSYDMSTLRRLNANRYLPTQNPYQSMPFMASRGQFYPQRAGGMVYYDNVTTKVPAQTQTSIDGDSHHEDEHPDEETTSAPNSPSGQRRKRVVKRDKAAVKDQRPLSPAAQRRLRKQSSVTSTDSPDSPGKMARKRPRKLSTTTTSDVQEDKNESRSSSSGQDSPRKDQNKRVSVYINSKRRSSQTSLKTSRSGSVDASKDKYGDGGALSSERERTNSVSSRETASVKARKTSTSSGNVPWCACWGNGCI